MPQNSDAFIRYAADTDAQALLDIYAYYVTNTAVTFECTVPPLSEFRRRIKSVSANYPYLVLQSGDDIIGFAYAAPFHVRQAYFFCAETTIYLRQNVRMHGYGTKLYETLLHILQDMGVRNCYACVAETDTPDEYLQNDSKYFHEKRGWKQIAKFNRCGYKFSRFYNMIWLERILDAGGGIPHVTPINKLSDPNRYF